MRADGARRHECAAEEIIERAGTGILHALLQDEVNRPGFTPERRGANVRAYHALRHGRFRAIGAQCLAAPGTNGHGFGVMGGTFH